MRCRRQRRIVWLLPVKVLTALFVGHRRYLDFDCPIQRVKPHQTLAINRGETRNILTVGYHLRG